MTLGRSVAIGTTGFALASVAVFGFWAAAGRGMQRSFGEAGFYAVCAALFILLGALLLRPLARLSFARFLQIFGGAFAAYALCWCLGWFLVRGRMGEVIGPFVGSLSFCAVPCAYFRNWHGFALSALILFVGHSAGYFLVGYAYEFLKTHNGLIAKLAWGLCYGLGTGAGLGYAFWAAQRSAVAPVASNPEVS